MRAWGYKIIEFEASDVQTIKEKPVIACQVAEAGACGYHGGVFMVTSDREVYFTCFLEPSDYSGHKKYTSLSILKESFPPLSLFDRGILGHGTNSPDGYKHIYLGMGNHLFVKENVYRAFNKLAESRLEEYPEAILYNLWLDVIMDILSAKEVISKEQQ